MFVFYVRKITNVILANQIFLPFFIKKIRGGQLWLDGFEKKERGFVVLELLQQGLSLFIAWLSVGAAVIFCQCLFLGEWL